MKTGIELIAEERQRQLDEEGYTFEHDIYEHYAEDLSVVASLYALPEKQRQYRENGVPKNFPWEIESWKPTPNDRIRELQKAGALIAAEIDRIKLSY